MKKSENRISIVPLISTTDWSVGKQLLEIFAAADERLLPERISLVSRDRSGHPWKLNSSSACMQVFPYLRKNSITPFSPPGF